jgi:hypothetical protein
LHHLPSRWRGRVDRLGKAPKSRFGLAQPFHDRQDIAKRTGQSIKLAYYEHICFAQLSQNPVELGPVPPTA